jgi:hypothetical protein
MYDERDKPGDCRTGEVNGPDISYARHDEMFLGCSLEGVDSWMWEL